MEHRSRTVGSSVLDEPLVVRTWCSGFRGGDDVTRGVLVGGHDRTGHATVVGRFDGSGVAYSDGRPRDVPADREMSQLGRMAEYGMGEIVDENTTTTHHPFDTTERPTRADEIDTDPPRPMTVASPSGARDQTANPGRVALSMAPAEHPH